MRVIVSGGRDYDDYDKVKEVLDSRKDKITEIISGRCRRKGPFDPGPKGDYYADGADGLGERWADENSIPWIGFYAEDYGKWPECGPNRNGAMVKYAAKSPDGGALVAFPGGSGTADVTRKAKAAKLAVLEVE